MKRLFNYAFYDLLAVVKRMMLEVSSVCMNENSENPRTWNSFDKSFFFRCVILKEITDNNISSRSKFMNAEALRLTLEMGDVKESEGTGKLFPCG